METWSHFIFVVLHAYLQVYIVFFTFLLVLFHSYAGSVFFSLQSLACIVDNLRLDLRCCVLHQSTIPNLSIDLDQYAISMSHATAHTEHTFREIFSLLGRTDPYIYFHDSIPFLFILVALEVNLLPTCRSIEPSSKVQNRIENILEQTDSYNPSRVHSVSERPF
jgi:hypothetical protein